MEKKIFRSVYLPNELVATQTEKAVLWKIPEIRGEADKYFWVSKKFVHPIGKDFVVKYTDDFNFTVFEQVKNNDGYFEKTNFQEVTGDELRGIYAKYDPEIEKSYVAWLDKKEHLNKTAIGKREEQSENGYKQTNKVSQKNEFRKALADQFLKLLDPDNPQKSFAWIKQWRMNGGHQNLNSGRNYRGINRLALAFQANKKGYKDPRWVTFNGLKEYEGAYIKKGEVGTSVEYWVAEKTLPVYDEETKKMKRYFTIAEMNQYLEQHPEEALTDFKIKARYAKVFNAEQCIGLPEYVPQVTNDKVTQSDLVTNISESMGVKIFNDQGSDECYYSPMEDVIHLPKPTAFVNDYAYNSTALHELAHSTGATNRLDRNLQNYFGNADYAFEELVAEMTSAMVAISLLEEATETMDEYLEQHAKNHQAYVQDWMKRIEQDMDVLPRALKLAELSADFMELHGGLMSLDEYNSYHRYEKPVIADETTGKLFVASLAEDNVLNCENKFDEFKIGTVTPTLFPNQQVKNTTGIY